ncbi:membrane protein insertase YidC [Mycoplasma struthionis]|uniref:membrane protein insertase YidC n=1 Tax=Mycoplasma struthionis TaxID=538220 RepID=UPI0021BD0DDB|nr:membrane protein insertase YidC [Mycoplasma struthionis]
MEKIQNKKSPKNVFKQVWKWIKIVIIVLFVTVGLVGCVQSFTVKSSNKVGSGQELYANTEKISPNVVTFRYDKNAAKFILPNKLNKEKNLAVNTYLGLKEPGVLPKLRDQDNASGAQYGIYGGQSFALQLDKLIDEKRGMKAEDNLINITNAGESKKDGYIYGRDGKYVYFNFGKDEKGVVTGNTKVYKPVSKFTNILLPLVLNWKTTEKEAPKNNTTNGTNTSVTYDLVNDYTTISKLRLAIIKSDVSSLLTPENYLIRDVIQILFEETFSQWSKNDEIFKQALNLNENDTKAEILAKWNNYISNIYTKFKAGEKLDEKSGFQLQLLAIKLQEASKEYLNNASFFATENITPEGYQEFAYSPFSGLGNYNPNAWRNRLFNVNNSLVPRRALSTAKDYWSQGPFFGMFVQPVNLFMNTIITSLGTTGWSVILALTVTLIIVRLLTFIISFKSLFGQAKMEEFNQKKAKVEAKYAPYKGDKQMQQRKQMEISELYKREKINPFGQIVTMFLTLPILIVVFRIISTNPEIKQATWYGIRLSATSFFMIVQNKDYSYLPIILISILVQALAQYTPKLLMYKKNKSLRADAYQREAMKKENRKYNIMSLIFIFLGAIFSAGLQIYWIIGGIWTILQHIFVHYFQRTKLFKNKIYPKL